MSKPLTPATKNAEDATLSAPSRSRLPSSLDTIAPLPIPKVKPIACIIDINASKLLTAAVTGSGFGVRAALVAGMSALGVSNKRVEWQDFGGADDVVDTVDKNAADIVLKMLKVS